MSILDNLLIPDDFEERSPLITVIGVGGGGCNAVKYMYNQGLNSDVHYVICNTDAQQLNKIDGPKKIKLGYAFSKGLGAGLDPEKGRIAAEQSEEDIKASIGKDCQMVFITAGMGGGTGTGASPVIAKIAKSMGILTVGVVTLPFKDEGEETLKRGARGVKELQKYVDSIILIENDKLYEIYENLPVAEAFPRANDALKTAVYGITNLVLKGGFINLDMEDVKKIMRNSGMACMGVAEAEGDDRAREVVERAIKSPLLNEYDLTHTTGVLLNVTTSEENGGLTMTELKEIMENLNSYTSGAIIKNFKRGITYDASLGRKVRLTIVATGYNLIDIPILKIATDEEGIDIATIPTGDGVIDSVETIYSPILNKEKPALILDYTDDILKLEQEPAIRRRESQQLLTKNI